MNDTAWLIVSIFIGFPIAWFVGTISKPEETWFWVSRKQTIFLFALFGLFVLFLYLFVGGEI
jgi:hypothetical protein